MEPAAIANLCQILFRHSNSASCHLASIATQMPWSAPLRYVNAIDGQPRNVCIFPGTSSWAGVRGGNEAAVCFKQRKTNLHSAWDGDLPEQAIARVPANYSHPLPFPPVEESLHGSDYGPMFATSFGKAPRGGWAHEALDWISCPLSQPLRSTLLPQPKTSRKCSTTSFSLDGSFKELGVSLFPRTLNSFSLTTGPSLPMNSYVSSSG